ncbi:glycosyltransferase family A protein [Streptomyces sp. NPDC005648]|uniref:glycosyltransferase family A protein n=1 Tax=Streptomyces sp. NPDC005648 TaxID=3157044 RepID=UPI0033AA8885
MPTRDRRRFVPRAIAYFLRQEQPAIELVVIDNGTDDVEDLVPRLPSVRYHRVTERMTVGTARNLACEMASGALTGVGAGRSVRHDEPALPRPVGGRAWRFTWPPRLHRWFAGQSLCYRRETVVALALPRPPRRGGLRVRPASGEPDRRTPVRVTAP